MYVRGYLQGSENGRVVTIERDMGKFTTMFTLSQSGADQRNKARKFVIIRFTCTLVKKILVNSVIINRIPDRIVYGHRMLCMFYCYTGLTVIVILDYHIVYLFCKISIGFINIYQLVFSTCKFATRYY